MTKEMRIDDGHFHARTSYQSTRALDYIHLVQDVVETRSRKGKSLNVHIPFEIQHPQVYSDTLAGLNFILFGEKVKRVSGVPFYWENAPEETYGVWDMAHGQTDWTLVPYNLELTLVRSI